MQFKRSSTLSNAVLSAAKELVKMLKEVGLAVNSKAKEKDLASKKDRRLYPHIPEMVEDLKYPQSLATMS